MEDQVKKLMLGLLAYAAQRDLPVDNLCRLANISLNQLQNNHEPLTAKQVGDIWVNAIHLSKDQLFGLHFGEALQLSALGLVGDIIKSSTTVGSALTLAASLTHLITAAFKLTVTQDQDTFMVRFIPTDADWKNNPTTLHTLNLLMVFVIHELDGLLLKKIVPMAVNLGFQIKDRAEYARVMRCIPQTNTSENALTFNAGYWNEPIITANYELQKILLEKVNAQLPTSPGKQSLKNRIRQYLMSNSYLGIVSLDDIASNFNISARTLQRKLKEEGINFQQLADEARMDLAINYLKEGTYPVKQVSHMLGYNELSAFTRTFKRWTGITPAIYQKSLTNLS